MKPIIYKTIAILSAIFISSQLRAQNVDYRDSVTGYYECDRVVNYFFVDTFYATTTVIITKNTSNDSLIHFNDDTYNVNLHLTSSYYFYYHYPSNGDISGTIYTSLDSLFGYYFHTFGPANQPVGTTWACNKTGPLALDENIKSKLIIGQSLGFITIIQPEAIVDRVKLYSIDGKELLNETLYSTNNTIGTSNLPTGIYLLAFYKSNQFIDSKRVVITN